MVTFLLSTALYLGSLLAAGSALGWYMSRIYQGQPPRAARRLLTPLERGVYRLLAVDPEEEMDWRTYSQALLYFSLFGVVFLYLLERLQGLLPLNPQRFPGVPSSTALNAALSFVTNTNWQSYGGESTMSHLTQMAGLATQNFLSAAAGMAVLVALIRGLVRVQACTIGNFWVDLTRGVVYVLLPLSLLLAPLLVWQGIIQDFGPYRVVAGLENAGPQAADKSVRDLVIPTGPVASQVAIKQLGTNGGGFFNANSCHPFENPTPLSNFLESLAILLIPVALCFTFGRMVGDARQGRALLAAMLAILIPLLVTVWAAERAGNPVLAGLGLETRPGPLQPGGNMEGKEVRFGIADSALWATATSAASNGSVNAMLDSFTPLGGMVPLWLIQLGEIVFGGVGSGLYGMIVFTLVTVFLAGLMVGRTPEYLGKKVESFEIQMASLVILIPAALVLVGTAVSVVLAAGRGAVGNPGPHGFSEVLYAFSSAANNNGSAMGGLAADTPWYNLSLGVAMFCGRFLPMMAVLAMAGSFATKKRIPTSAGTLPTHSPLFVLLLVGVILLVGALTFFPALALGPLAEHLAASGQG